MKITFIRKVSFSCLLLIATGSFGMDDNKSITKEELAQYGTEIAPSRNGPAIVPEKGSSSLPRRNSEGSFQIVDAGAEATKKAGLFDLDAIKARQTDPRNTSGQGLGSPRRNYIDNTGQEKSNVPSSGLGKTSLSHKLWAKCQAGKIWVTHNKRNSVLILVALAAVGWVGFEFKESYNNQPTNDPQWYTSNYIDRTAMVAKGAGLSMANRPVQLFNWAKSLYTRWKS